MAREQRNADEMLELIFDYVAKIANERNLERLIRLMADMGKEMIEADRCSVFIYDRRKQELWTMAAHGMDEIRVPADAGIVGYTVRTGEPIIIRDAYEDSRFNREVDKRSGYRTKAMLTIPIRDNDGEILGAYQAVNKMTPEGEFTEQDLRYLSLASSYSGKSIEAAILHREIEETQREIIFVMGEIGETRSKETGQHVKRVAEYSKLLALSAGLSADEAELIKLASPMHDIGKVAIPDAILNKPAKLTEEEYEVMKSHTLIGYNLLKNSQRRILQAASVIALTHHEKWNGKGYPHGTGGEDIPLYGRITAVADVFDALASSRKYKAAWEIDRIVRLFGEERGRHFDARLVDAFLDHLDDVLAIRDAYPDSF